MGFEVKTDIFEGPFDLLLQLIMRQELDIYQVPIAQITASYLEYIEGVSEIDLDGATEFLLIAATLLLIKTRSLLPRPDEEPFEVLEESETAREFLIERLIEYKKFQNAAVFLEGAYAVEGLYMSRLREMEDDFSRLYPDPFEGVEAKNLGLTLVELLLERNREQVDISHIAPIKVSIAEQIERVRNRVFSEDSVTFSKLVEECHDKIELVATFLAILELHKRGEVLLSQRKLFGEIHVKKREGEKSIVA